MILPIVQYPDESLRRVSNHVYHIDGDILALLDDMGETVKAAPGAGLAAIQVGVPLRIFLLNNRERIETFINPRIVSRLGEQTYTEGCLSVAGQRVEKKRARTVTVEARNRRGELFTRTFEGFWAVAVQHEYDHLDGKLLIDEESDP